ncbi:AP-3 complex subunit beta-2 [Apophysomyces sp. BC1034]|nr:AP-3 complex subunit beta-2 [Apophysomyces sp. BC1034]
MEVSDYFNKARTFAENAAKLSQKMSQGIVDNARELGFPGGDSGAQYFDTSEEKMRNIRRQLDAKNDREKLDGLKRLIAMISKGRDVSEFFPDVVKNVVSQNIEIRKLVYIYLLRYAEQEPDLALLSINSFQKDLSDKNQIIRAMALRVMSGIRVPVISPIVLLGIKKCTTDSSPYVRKTAAHAIPKCYSLDATQKDALIEIVVTLLKDRSNITIGSTIMAFNELCPSRFDLIHPCFRKLCGVLADCDEWGQMAILDLLLRYGRTQFLNPNPNGEGESRTPPKASNNARNREFYSDSSDEEDEKSVDSIVEMDEDHELLLRSCIPLLQSRNSGVVLEVAKLFYYLAPAHDAQKIARPLVRLLRNHRELQYVVLANISVMSKKRPYLFEPFLQQFYVQSSEPAFIRDTKLDILTNIVTESNIHMLLNELQNHATKLQILTLSAKLVCLNPSHTTLDNLNQYVLNLARYDLNYDVRDRARFLRVLTLPTSDQQSPGLEVLKQQLKRVLMSDKEPPVTENTVQYDAEYSVGSLSMLANQPLPGYEPLPDYPTERPDPSVRDVEELEGWGGSQTVVLEHGFGSDSFDSRYRGERGFSGASTAISGIEASGISSVRSTAAKKKDGNYDLDAFYEESTDEEDEEEDYSSSEEESSENDVEESSEEEADSSDEDGEEYSSEYEEEIEVQKSELVQKSRK